MSDIALPSSQDFHGVILSPSIIPSVQGVKVSGLHPKLADAIEKMLTEAKARKLPACGVHSVVRTWDEQQNLYELGRSIRNPDGSTDANPRGNIVTWTIAGYSWHNYGLAADIVFKDAKGWTWDDSMPWEELGKIGELYGLEWGGRWKKKDLPHFQKVGTLKIGQARALVLSGGIEKVWELI